MPPNDPHFCPLLLLGVPALAVTPLRQELLGLLAQWAEEDTAEPDPGFDIDFAELGTGAL